MRLSGRDVAVLFGIAYYHNWGGMCILGTFRSFGFNGRELHGIYYNTI
jgi:hypothetical protein